jgi:uncharacterized lipoprotein (TIGR02269 family)
MAPSARSWNLLWLSLAVLLLSACGTTSSSSRAWEGAEWAGASACEEPGADQCIVFACDVEEGVCGVFACEDVDPEAVAGTSLAHGAELARSGGYRHPSRPPAFRNWRNSGVREGARPRMTFHFRYPFGALPAFPRYEGRVVKHHLFPKAAEFRDWFRRAGINIHDWTMVIPEHIHRQIHSGTGRGGLWNTAWRVYMDANPNPPGRDVLLRHAIELAFRYELTGPIVPYNHQVVPIGPQLYGN